MIREIKRSDYEKIYQLGSELHENFRCLYHLEEVLKNDYFKILVYEKDSTVLAFLMYTLLEGTIDIVDLIVDKNFRRQHIATFLMDELITKSHVGDKLYLEVRVDNEAAITLYEKFGFQVIHTRKKYYGDKDAYVMERVNENE